MKQLLVLSTSLILLFSCNVFSQTFNQITTMGDLTDGNYLIVGDGSTNDGLMVNTSSGSVIIDYTAITNPGATINSGFTANNIFTITVTGGNITIYNATNGYASWGRTGVTGNDADFFNGAVTDFERWTPTVAGGLWTLRNVDDNSRMLQWNNSSPRFVAYTSNQVKLKLYKETVSCTPPTTQPTSITFPTINSNDLTINWTGGNGSNSLVVISEGSAVSSNPASGVAYTANAAFGSGDDLGSNNYVVYNGTGSSVNVTGLNPNTTYHVAIFEFNTADNCYNTTSPTTDNETTACAAIPDPTTGFAATVGNQQATLTWTNPVACYDEVLVLADDGTITHVPSGNGSAYTANSVYGSGSNHGSNEYAVYQGTGTSVTVTGLTNGDSYCFKIWVRYGSNWSVQEVTCGNVPNLVYCGDGITWSNLDSEIENVTLNGENNNISNNTASSCTGAIQDYTAMSADLEQGGTYTVDVEFGDCGAAGIDFAGAGGVWIDWNNDGDFSDANEEIGTTSFSSGANVIETFTINVPGGQAIGNYRMRVVQDEGGSTGSIDPCVSPGYGAIEDYTVEIIVSCIPTHSITSFTPTSGPELTELTVTGTGFTNATTAEVGGVAATVTYVNSTTLIVEIPVGATSSTIDLTESACSVSSAGTFSVISYTGTCSSPTAFTDLIISEVYDSDANNVWYIELYNPTGSAIDLGAENYQIERYGDAFVSVSRTINLTGVIPAGGIFLINIGSSANTCTESWDFFESGAGINENDGIMLVHNGVDVDAVECPNQTGYSILRDPTGSGPTTTFNSSEWTTDLTEDCADLGNFVAPPTYPTVATHPSDLEACFIDYTSGGTAGNGGTITYQWKYNDGSAAGWSDVTAGAFAPATVTGETTANLQITGTPTEISAFDGYQFYCEIIEDGVCIAPSRAAQFDAKAGDDPNIQSAMINGCQPGGSADCSSEGYNEFMVVNSGSQTVVVDPSNITISYGTSSPATDTYTDSFVSDNTLVSAFNSENTSNGCSGNIFVDAVATGTLPANSTFFLMSENACPTAYDFSSICAEGPIYLLFSSDGSWGSTGNWANSGVGDKYFEISITDTDGITTTTEYHYDPTSLSNADGDYANFNFCGGAPVNYGNDGCSPQREVLPVAYNFFDGELVDNYGDLYWSTASEINAKEFVVMKSGNGSPYAPIGSVAAAGNSTENNYYKFEDHNLVDGDNYYQLYQYDFDGAVQKSKVVLIQYETHKFFVVNNEGQAIINYSNLPYGSTIYIYAIDGKLVDVISGIEETGTIVKDLKKNQNYVFRLSTTNSQQVIKYFHR